MISRKKFGIGMLFLAMLLVSIVLVSAANAAADKASAKNPSDSKVETFGIKGLDTKKVNEIESKARDLNNLPATIYNAPYWMKTHFPSFLFLNNFKLFSVLMSQIMKIQTCKMSL
jgi:hypothetical protein